MDTPEAEAHSPDVVAEESDAARSDEPTTAGASIDEPPSDTTESDASRDEDDAPRPSLVRPYTLTAGRTKSDVYLPLEAPVHTTSPIVPSTWPASDVRTKIVALCMDGPSIAEISAQLKLPLGVARVLVGDLVESGTLRVSVTLDDDATAAERRELIGRTLRGLRAL